MKFHFKIQPYQTEAVESIVNVFKGQTYTDKVKYIRDLGNYKVENQFVQTKLDFENNDAVQVDMFDETGYKNELLELQDLELLNNIHEMQKNNNIKLSKELVKDLGRCNLDIEMETGTGKTYVYIKTMFELNKKYGWTKFIVVVPSIAIREGVIKSFEITTEHFMQHYGKKARAFVYSSSNLHKIDEFSSNAGINVMIINTQAFASSLKEGGRSKESRIIYSKRDEFASRKPIDVIKANNPILILDEPQKMGGKVTQTALKNFNALFTLNYSATHKKQNNMVYVLDALDAYNERLVKKIEVKGFEVKNLRGTDKYLYLENIVLSANKPPRARIEIEIDYNKSINRETRILKVGDDLFYISKEMEQYKGYTVSEINSITGTVTFTNGEVIKSGEITGDIAEKDMRRIQIRETILSHFEKEEKLFNMGIKTLSLFFIDEVAKYRQYNEVGDEVLGEYGQIFEEEYVSILNEYIKIEETPYIKYLKEIDTKKTHTGYFSIDKKSGKAVDSKVKRGAEFSDDISAYDLILKNKERLLSFEEPTRFIFSHSALREGWDNPNVFQICTLKHSESTVIKRQEVGRGLRLCVNAQGDRMDLETCGESIHDINKLTVIASESYKDFVGELQKQMKEVLYDRPTKATQKYFEGKVVKVDDESIILSSKQARDIYKYLLKNDYIDDDDHVTEEYRQDLANNNLLPLPESVNDISEGVHLLVRAVFDESVLKNMFENAKDTKTPENVLNDNFYKKEFQTLWKQINRKYAYTAHFDSNELIKNSIKAINDKLYVSRLKYTASTGEQKNNINEHEVQRGDSFNSAKTRTETLKHVGKSEIKYDLVGKIASATTLTRKTVVQILKGLKEEKFYLFLNNPEEFIKKVIKLIKEQKATIIVEHISYNEIEGKYDSGLFTAQKTKQTLDKAFRAEKHIQDYVYTDGLAEKSVEKRFAMDLEAAREVCVYAKLPKGFAIPTPVGNYSPDWAIAFYEGTVKHIYFIAETKGTMESLQLRPIEKAKISCAKKLFNEISSDDVKYHDVDGYEELLNIVNSDKFDDNYSIDYRGIGMVADEGNKY